MKGLTTAVAAALFAATSLVATPAFAQMTGTPTPGFLTAPGAPSQTMPSALREIGFDQNLDQKLPLDAQFVDDEGKGVALGSYYGGKKPVLLAFVYYTCPMLCTQVLNAMTATISMLSLDAGKDFDLVLISIDPRETPAQAAAKKAEYVHRYKRPGSDAGWHFLTGQETDIKRVAKAAGFRYAWDEQTQQYAHPTGVIVTTPDGRLARYLFGIEYGPRDLKLALVEASDGKVGSYADQLLLYCYHYDPMTGRYGVYIMRTLRVAGVLTVLSIGMFILVMVRREKSQQFPAH
ncbi:MAG: SCO family protein [Vicinamibacterales bacterium]